MQSTTKAPFILGCALAALLCACARAETPADIRYELFRDENGRYRFDRFTGKLEKMSITPEGVVYTEMPVLVSKKSPAGTRKPAAMEVEAEPEPRQKEMATINPGRRPGKIDFEDEKGNKLSEDITDEDRKSAIADIARYEKDLAIMQTLKSGDRIAGAIVVRNKGDRSIQKLEVTLYVPVVGKDRPEEYRFLFVDNGAEGAPLQPLGTTGESRSWLQPVDVASPAGNVKGNLDVKLTYIKFYEKK
ncbi:MAG TPA: hypothetical protein VEJ63_16475 [Planctomycetota bacterium]|nr:hypothetical protein [Planctomycetota bacterium]